MKLAILLMTLFIVTIGSAFAGNELGNGGDIVAQEFIAAGRQLVEEIRKNPDPRIPDVERLAEAIETVTISTTEALTLQGREVDALNYPERKHIEVSRSRWREAGAKSRASLVLHEYLGVMNVPDDRYEISGTYASAFESVVTKPKRSEISLFSNYGASYTRHNPRPSIADQPGFGISLGFNLDTNSTVGMRFDSQSYKSEYDGFVYQKKIFEIAGTYKYSPFRHGKFRPYILGGLGLGRISDEWPSEQSFFAPNMSSNEQGLTSQLALGTRYALLSEIGIDFSLNAHSIYHKQNIWRMLSTNLFGQVGVDAVF